MNRQIKKNILFLPAVFLAVFLFSGCSSDSTASITNGGGGGAQRVNNIDLEAKCATQAKKVYDENWSFCSGGICNYSYQNHYNSKDGKCYILVSGFGAGGQNYQLSDAFENGTYIALCDSYTAVPKLDSCDYPNARKQKFDIDAFNNFAKPYMNN